MFQAATLETALKYGSEWQKKVLNSMNFTGDRRFITVLAMPSLMMPGMRALTSMPEESSNPDREWHIDGNEERSHEHLFPTDICHLYLAHTSQPTEFNVNPIEITDREIFMLDRLRFCTHLCENVDTYSIEAKEIELDRIYKFSNHLHRAQIPNRIEFRYSMRIRETDQEYIGPGLESQFLTRNRFSVPDKVDLNHNIRVNNKGEIVITPPKGLQTLPEFLLKNLAP